MLQTTTKATTPCSLETFKEWLKVTSATTKAITALSSAGTVATATCTGHGYATGAFGVIAGASPAGYNGSFVITVVDANTFTYNLAASASSPASGSPTITPDDGRYSAMIDAAADDFDTFTGVPIVSRTIVETVSGEGKTSLVLGNSPVSAIASITIDGATVDPTTYKWTAAGLIMLTTGSFSAGVLNVVVTYTAGYDAVDGPALPADVVVAQLTLGKAIHDATVANAIAASTVSLGPSSMVIRPSARPATVQAVFDNYKAAGYRP